MDDPPEPARPVEPIDVVVVTYQSAAWIGRCLDSLIDQEGIGTIVVVDGGSTDNTAGVVRRYIPLGVGWLPLGVNRGFGSSANRGIAATSSESVLVLNPDLVVEPGCVRDLGRAMQADVRLAIVGPTVGDLDGTPYPSARAFPHLIDAVGHGFIGLFWKENPWSKRYLVPNRVDWISGTAMLLRRQPFESVGGFDESYFMYVEDVDLAWRLAEKGWTVALVAAATVRHAIGGSSESVPYRMIVAHHRSLWRFATKTTQGVERLLLPVVAVGLFTRAGLVALRRLINGKPPAAR